jgi:four helix bundle protein
MSKIERFEDLKCWQDARKLVSNIFLVSRKGELAKDYDLKSQFKRASLSTMNNIAEGFARYHSKEFVRFLDFSQSSSAEVKSMLYVIEDLEYLDKEAVNKLHKNVDDLRNQTLGLIRYINKRNKSN